MNISDIVNATAANNLVNTKAKTSAQATTALSPVQEALKKTTEKFQTEVDSTTAQLSSLGQLKSAVSSAQLSARALSHLPVSASSADVKTAATHFLRTFNAAIGSAKTTAAAPGSATTASSANRASRDLSRAVMTDVRTFDAMKKLGFSLHSDGTLALDAKKFEAAQKADPAGAQATLAKIGQQVDKTATRELASTGAVTGSMAALTARASLLQMQQSSLATLVKNTADAVSNPSTNSWSSGFGVSAYQANAKYR
jgi:flagellar capping protein FliD